jgi:hypothetical protein
MLRRNFSMFAYSLSASFSEGADMDSDRLHRIKRSTRTKVLYSLKSDPRRTMEWTFSETVQIHRSLRCASIFDYLTSEKIRWKQHNDTARTSDKFGDSP